MNCGVPESKALLRDLLNMTTPDTTPEFIPQKRWIISDRKIKEIKEK
jgi:hypothetical protein